MSATFGGADGTSEINGVEGVRQTTSPEEFEGYTRMLKATRSIIKVAATFFLAPSDSKEEGRARALLDQMLDDMARRPEKGHNIIESLLAIIVHLDSGGSLEEWFKGLDD